MSDEYNKDTYGDLHTDKDDMEKGNEVYETAGDMRQDSSSYSIQGEQIPKENYEGASYTYVESSYGTEESQEVGTEDWKEPNSGGKSKLPKLLASAALFGLVAGLVFAGVNKLTAPFTNKDTVVEKTNVELDSGTKIEKTSVAEGIVKQTSDVSGVVENTMPSIVSITSTMVQNYNWFGQDSEQESQGSGSGFIVGKNDKELLIVTNNHVVEGAKKLGVTFIDEKIVEAEVKGTDSAADLAVIAVKLEDINKKTLDAIKIATLGDSDDIKVGQMAIAIGNALGYGQSVTVGYISAKDREVAVSDTTMVLLQTDAAINPGNSGGALLNINGEVIGINSVKYASSEVEGMGYAIPISRATPIINELMKREKLKDTEKGYLGITGADVTEQEHEKYNMPIGVYVYQVADGGAAKEAGILPGDIITKINGAEVKTIAAVQEKVNSYRINTKITITVKRNSSGKYMEKKLSATLKSLKSLDSLKEQEEQTQDSQNPSGEEDNNSQQIPWEQPEGSEDEFSDFFGDFFN